MVTYTTRSYGTRTSLYIGACLEALALVGASFSNSIWQLFLSQGLCSGWGMGFLFLGTIGVVPQWFTKRRSLAAGLASAGAGTGGFVYNLSVNSMIRNISLPWAYRILAIVAFTTNITCASFIKDRNRQIGAVQKTFDYKLFTNIDFVALASWSFLSIIGYVILSFSLPSYAVNIGLSQQQGSIVGALLNVAQAVGRPVMGYLSDHLGRYRVTALASTACGLCCFFVWIFARNYGVLVFFAIMSGLFVGNNWAVRQFSLALVSKELIRETLILKQATAPVSAEIFGIKHLPSILSTLWLLLTIPGTCGYSPILLF